MANLNLSEFTEKTFVADADWTFVWDTAGLISKKVSRNSLLNSGTLTTSAPVTISQTWDALAVAFTAFKVNATSTNSAAGSLLLDLQEGGVSKLSVLKNGDLSIRNTGQIGTPNFLIGNSSSSGIYFASGDLRLYVDASSAKFAMSSATTSVKIGSNYSFGWSGSPDASQTPDTILLRDGAANTLALRNGAAAQTFNVYGTSSSSNTVYERMFARYDGTALAFQVGTQHVGASARPLQLLTDNTARMTIGTTGNVGIGTTAPSRLLSVVSNSIGANVLLVQNTNSTGYAEIAFDNDVPFAGNLGGFVIGLGGTTTPSPNEVYLFNRRSAAIFFGTNATERMRITAAGNVGIGTTAPSSKLQVSAGDVEVDTIAKGVILKSPDGTRYRVTVANGGTLSVAAV